jgi:hypothetical protein
MQQTDVMKSQILVNTMSLLTISSGDLFWCAQAGRTGF